MLRSNIIERRVMSVVKGLIKDAQKEYDLGIVTLEEEHAKEAEEMIRRHRAEVSSHTDKHLEDKESLAERLVKRITGKFL